MANTEADNTLFSTATYEILDLLGEGPHYRFMLKSGAYGNDPLVSTWFDGVPVRNLDGSYNFNVSGSGFFFDYLLGTAGQTGITGFQKVENLIPLSSNTRVANPPIGGGPWKPVVASFNSNTYPDADSVKVTMRVPAMYAQDSDGNTNPFSMFYEIDISVNNGPWVAQFLGTDGEGNDSTVYEVLGKCTTPYQKTHLLTLPKTTPASAFYEWKIRIRRTDTNILKITTANELFVDSIAVVSSSLFAYPNSVLVGIKISADQFASIPSRAYEMEGLLVPIPSGYRPTQYPVTGGIVPAVYPTVWYGDFTGGAWTDNPAWIYYDLLTNPVHGLGDFIPSGSVDKWSLYDISQFCDQMVDDGASGYEPNFTCNVVIQQPEQAFNVLLNLASTFRGMLYYANGTVHATQTENKVPLYAFTNANVIDGQFSYSDTANNTRSTVALVKWIDPDNGYRENVEYIEDPDGIQRYGYQEKQITAFACTSKGQAYRLGAWTLNSERLLTETITFQTSLEGLSLRPGDAFGVYDNFRNNRSQGGRILGFDSTRSLITLDRQVTVDSSYIYSLSAVIPKAMFDGTGDITGSDQIDLIRQSQIETFRVITPPTSGTNQLLISGMFSTGLFIGSPWVLDASGSSSVFHNATFYTCLATAEIKPGIVEVLGLQANTGIQFVIQTGYTTVDYPSNAGDSTSISPPTNFSAVELTGQYTDGVFYDVIRTAWNNTPNGSNLSHYDWSGRTFNGAYEQQSVFGTTTDFDRTSTGQYLFRVAAVSLGGVKSTYLTGGLLITSTNPLGTLRQLSGIQIIDDYDPLYTTTSGYTGFIGRRPTFEWNVLYDSNGDPIVDLQFISGYRISGKSFDGTTRYFTVDLSGADTTTYQFPDDSFVYTGFSQGAVRGFILQVNTIDIYGNVAVGAGRPFANPPMKPPFSSGFVGYNGGVMYNVTPSIQYDTSGIMLWVDQSSSFTPTFQNADYVSTNLAGSASIAPNTGTFYTWFSLIDTYNSTGNLIFGPVSGNAGAVIADDSIGLDKFLPGIEPIQVVSSLASITSPYQGQVAFLTTDNKLYRYSGTAWTTVVDNSDLADNAVTVSKILDGAVSELKVANSAITATKIATDAVTDVKILAGSVTTAKLDTLAVTSDKIAANAIIAGKIAALAVTAGTINANVISGVNIVSETIRGGHLVANTITGDRLVIGTIQGGFIAADAISGSHIRAQSVKVDRLFAGTITGQEIIIAGGTAGVIKTSNYVAGSAGWYLNGDGNVEFNNITGRGNFSAINGSYSAAILVDAGRSLIMSKYGSNEVATFGVDSSNTNGFLYVREGDTSNILTAYSSAGQATVTVDGNLEIWQNGGGNQAGTFKYNSDGRFEMGSNGTKSISFATNGSQRWVVGGSDGHIKALGSYDIRKATADGWTVKLHDGTYTLEFQSNGTQIYGRIDGGSAILLG